MASNELEYGLQQLLVADSTVASLIQTRFYPLLLPTDSPRPSVTYQRIGTVTLHGLADNFSLTQSRLQIDTWGDAFTDARAVASAITDVVEGYAGTLPNGVAVSDVVLDSQIDLYDSVARLYRVSLDFLIWYSR